MTFYINTYRFCRWTVFNVCSNACRWAVLSVNYFEITTKGFRKRRHFRLFCKVTHCLFFLFFRYILAYFSPLFVNTQRFFSAMKVFSVGFRKNTSRDLKTSVFLLYFWPDVTKFVGAVNPAWSVATLFFCLVMFFLFLCSSYSPVVFTISTLIAGSQFTVGQ